MFDKAEIIKPYFQIFDLVLCMMTPMMFTFVGVMTVLSEIDNGTAKYLCVTPVGKSGYISSRIIIPSIISFFYCILLQSLFSIINIPFIMTMLIAISSVLMSIAISLFVISFAKNKLEGMALLKTSGLLFLGIPVVYLFRGAIQYTFSLIPSFWITKSVLTGKYLLVLPSIFVCVFWIFILSLKFKKKLI